jgi:hypothetical protein
MTMPTTHATSTTFSWGPSSRARVARARGWSCAALLVCVGAIGTVSVESRAAGNDETMAAGLQQFDQGRRAYEAGQFEQALLAFQGSYELFASPNTRYYVGRCYRALGKVASAYTAFKLAAREAQDRLTASGEKRYMATRDAAAHEAAEIDAKVPRLTITVPSGAPAGFTVKRNGQEVPRPAWGVAVETDPGDAVVEASGPRLVPFEKKVTLAEGAQVRVDVEAKRLPTAVVVVALQSRPSGLAASLDGQPVDIGTVEAPREVDVGDHTLVVSAPGYLPFQWSKSLTDGEHASVEAVLRPDERALGGHGGTPPWLFFTVGGAAVAALGVASGIAAHAQSLQNQQLALDPYARDSSVRDSIRSQATIANVLFVGGGVLGAGAVVLAFLTQWKATESSPEAAQAPAAALAPWIGPMGGGVVANGSF